MSRKNDSIRILRLWKNDIRDDGKTEIILDNLAKGNSCQEFLVSLLVKFISSEDKNCILNKVSYFICFLQHTWPIKDWLPINLRLMGICFFRPSEFLIHTILVHSTPQKSANKVILSSSHRLGKLKQPVLGDMLPILRASQSMFLTQFQL